MTAAHHRDIIEGSYRVVASRPVQPRGRASPRARRMVARIVFWNCAVALMLILAPRLVG